VSLGKQQRQIAERNLAGLVGHPELLETPSIDVMDARRIFTYQRLGGSRWWTTVLPIWKGDIRSYKEYLSKQVGGGSKGSATAGSGAKAAAPKAAAGAGAAKAGAGGKGK
jgi:hypothetical protein